MPEPEDPFAKYGGSTTVAPPAGGGAPGEPDPFAAYGGSATPAQGTQYPSLGWDFVKGTVTGAARRGYEMTKGAWMAPPLGLNLDTGAPGQTTQQAAEQMGRDIEGPPRAAGQLGSAILPAIMSGSPTALAGAATQLLTQHLDMFPQWVQNLVQGNQIPESIGAGALDLYNTYRGLIGGRHYEPPLPASWQDIRPLAAQAIRTGAAAPTLRKLVLDKLADWVEKPPWTLAPQDARVIQQAAPAALIKEVAQAQAQAGMSMSEAEIRQMAANLRAAATMPSQAARAAAQARRPAAAPAEAAPTPSTPAPPEAPPEAPGPPSEEPGPPGAPPPGAPPPGAPPGGGGAAPPARPQYRMEGGLLRPVPEEEAAAAPAEEEPSEIRRTEQQAEAVATEQRRQDYERQRAAPPTAVPGEPTPAPAPAEAEAPAAEEPSAPGPPAEPATPPTPGKPVWPTLNEVAQMMGWNDYAHMQRVLGPDKAREYSRNWYRGAERRYAEQQGVPTGSDQEELRAAGIDPTGMSYDQAQEALKGVRSAPPQETASQNLTEQLKQSLQEEPAVVPETQKPGVTKEEFDAAVKSANAKLFRSHMGLDPSILWEEGPVLARYAMQELVKAGQATYENFAAAMAKYGPVVQQNMEALWREAKQPFGFKDQVSELVPGKDIIEKNRGFDPLTARMTPTRQALTKYLTPDQQAALANEWANSDLYPGLKLRKTDLGRPDRILGKAYDFILSNDDFLYHKVPATAADADGDLLNRESSAQWYQGYNRIADERARQYDLNDLQSSAGIAMLSPRTDWFQNVDGHRRILEGFFDDRELPWTTGMTSQANKVAIPPDILRSIAGKKLEALTDNEEIAWWIRLHDLAEKPQRNVMAYAPNGDPLGYVTNKGGGNAKFIWAGNGMAPYVKLIDILKDGSRENISQVLGDGTKIRSFANNGNSYTYDGAGDYSLVSVTSDTHKVAGGLLLPIGGQSPQVTLNFAHSPGNGRVGVGGSYGLFADASREGGRNTGWLPNQHQSITWDGARILMPSEWRTKENLAIVKGIWQKVDSGKLTRAQAQQQIFDLAGGWDKPRPVYSQKPEN